MKPFLFFNLLNMGPCASGEQASKNSANVFHICIIFLCKSSVRECCVSSSSKEQTHLIRNVSWCCSADCLRTSGLAASPAAGVAQAPTHPLIMAIMGHILLQYTYSHLLQNWSNSSPHFLILSATLSGISQEVSSAHTKTKSFYMKPKIFVFYC